MPSASLNILFKQNIVYNIYIHYTHTGICVYFSIIYTYLNFDYMYIGTVKCPQFAICKLTV